MPILKIKTCYAFLISLLFASRKLKTCWCVIVWRVTHLHQPYARVLPQHRCSSFSHYAHTQVCYVSTIMPHCPWVRVKAWQVICTLAIRTHTKEIITVILKEHFINMYQIIIQTLVQTHVQMVHLLTTPLIKVKTLSFLAPFAINCWCDKCSAIE